MAVSARVFFDEVQTVYAPLAEALGLAGPEASEEVMPNSRYTGPAVRYRIALDYSEGRVGCSVALETDTFILTVDVEPLALTAGVVEKRGGISYSAHNLKQLRKSLQGQADYVHRVNPLIIDADAAQQLMRQAGARTWPKAGTP